jgi:hypothetical protein
VASKSNGETTANFELAYEVHAGGDVVVEIERFRSTRHREPLDGTFPPVKASGASEGQLTVTKDQSHTHPG